MWVSSYLYFPTIQDIYYLMFPFSRIMKMQGQRNISLQVTSHRHPFIGWSGVVVLGKVMCKIKHYIVLGTRIFRQRVECFLPSVNENIPKTDIFSYEAFVGLLEIILSRRVCNLTYDALSPSRSNIWVKTVGCEYKYEKGLEGVLNRPTPFKTYEKKFNTKIRVWWTDVKTT